VLPGAFALLSAKAREAVVALSQGSRTGLNPIIR
jgi:hypothetical protein